MIHEVLNCLANEIVAYCGSNSELAEAQAVVGAIVNPAGTPALNTDNNIIISLVNIETDHMLKNYLLPNISLPIHPITPVNLNLYILIAANFANYQTSLKILFAAISFLQEKSLFNQSNSKWLQETVEQFHVEMVNMNFENLHDLWSTLGTSYKPSAVYKIGVQ